jgi:unsaturated rhamnogalacturonyl hydrolase
VIRSMLMLMLMIVATASTARALEVVAPLDGGVVLGDVLPLEVARTGAPPQVRLDGAAVSPTWTALPGGTRWFADLPLATRGAHDLEVWTAGASARVRFTSGLATSIEAGDLVLERVLASRSPQDLGWNWGPAVLLYGVHRFAQVSPQHARAAAFVHDYHAFHRGRGLPSIDHADRCPPALTALGLARAEGDPSALPNAERVADYVRRERRNAIGALDHLGSRSLLRTLASLSLVLRHWSHSVWLDSLFMYALFSVQWGGHTGDLALQDFGLSQPAIFARVLQDPRTGLLRHAWDVAHARGMGAYWLRGDAWVAAAIVDMLDEVPATHPRAPELLAVLRPLLDGLLARQDAAGLWPTLLLEPTSYQESSGSALAAYAVAKAARKGYVAASLRARARPTLRSLTARLRPRPVGMSVTGTSKATSVFPDFVYRSVVKRADDVDWGVGAYLLLAEELRAERWDVP